jgi:large subunit ribosomal protein L21
MHAVIQSGGKQYRVAEGDVVRLEKLNMTEGDTVDFDRVLMVGDGQDTEIGTPLVEGSRVSARIESHGRGKKVEVIKFNRRKKYRRHYGHRQDYTEVRITGIESGTATSAPAQTHSTVD